RGTRRRSSGRSWGVSRRGRTRLAAVCRGSAGGVGRHQCGSADTATLGLAAGDPATTFRSFLPVWFIRHPPLTPGTLYRWTVSRTMTAPRAQPGDRSMETPARRQYLEAKARYPDAILWFRMGDFYETFDHDAEVMARDLNITLTSREFGRGNRVPMA